MRCQTRQAPPISATTATPNRAIERAMSMSGAYGWLAQKGPARRSREPLLPARDDRRDEPAQELLAALGRSDLQFGLLVSPRRREFEERAALALRANEPVVQGQPGECAGSRLPGFPVQDTETG
jgi:hypothetical protein